MSTQITQAFVQDFKDQIWITAQQRGTRLRGTTLEQSFTGSAAAHEQISAVSANLRTTRHQPTPINSTPHTRRWSTMADYDWGDALDPNDDAKILIDPLGKYVQQGGWAMGRALDTVLLTAMTGNATQGQSLSGATSVVFDTTNNLILASDHTFDETNPTTTLDTNLAYWKMLKAKAIFANNGIDMDSGQDSLDELFIIVNGSQKSAILSNTKATQIWFVQVQGLVGGSTDYFIGFRFRTIAKTILPTTTLSSTTYDNVLAYARSGMFLDMNLNMTVNVMVDPSLSFATRAYVLMSLGAVRMEEKKVVSILNVQ